MRAALRELLEYVDYAVAHVPGALGVRLRAVYLRRRLAHLGARASFAPGVHVVGAAGIKIGDDFGCGRHCMLAAGGGGASVVGDRVNFNTNVSVNASIKGAVAIDDDVIIGPNAVLRTSDHVASAIDRPIREQGHTAGAIAVERDVWIGANVTVVGGVRLGQGSVVAAGAVVVRDVEPFTVVGGVTARFLKKRGE
jgi:galactoside O-acetyltransferase